jgi:hypothetical protein
MSAEADLVTSVFNNQGDATVSSQHFRTVMQLLDPGVFTDPFVDRLLDEFHKATGCSDASGSVDVSAFSQWIMSANDTLNAPQVHTKLLQVLESVVSICCYRCTQGKEAEWKKVVNDITADVQTGGVQGLLQCHHAMIGEQTFVCVGLFDSKKSLDDYKDTACKRYLEQMQPLIDGSAVFDDVGMALAAKSFGNPAAALQQICCMCSYQCAAGKEQEWESVVADITATVKSGGIEGMTNFISVMPDQRTFSCVGLFESQEAVDSYASMMSSQFIAKMKPLLGGDAIYDIVTPLQNCDPAHGAIAGA